VSERMTTLLLQVFLNAFSRSGCTLDQLASLLCPSSPAEQQQQHPSRRRRSDLRLCLCAFLLCQQATEVG
jgi:hypothetical protein